MTAKSIIRRFTLEMPDSLLRQVDEARGDVPRNAWIRRAIEQRLAEDHAISGRLSRNVSDS